MVMVPLGVLLASAASAYSLPPGTTRLSLPDCRDVDNPTACHAAMEARYRVSTTAISVPHQTSKERAFAEDGHECGLVGSIMCTSRTRTFFRSGENPVSTVMSSFHLQKWLSR
jgi:hypothetical protein